MMWSSLDGLLWRGANEGLMVGGKGEEGPVEQREGYLLRTMRSHTLQSDWSDRHSPTNGGQGIFPTQESNLGLLHCRQTLYRLIHWPPDAKS